MGRWPLWEWYYDHFPYYYYDYYDRYPHYFCNLSFLLHRGRVVDATLSRRRRTIILLSVVVQGGSWQLIVSPKLERKCSFLSVEALAQLKQVVLMDHRGHKDIM